MMLTSILTTKPVILSSVPCFLPVAQVLVLRAAVLHCISLLHSWSHHQWWPWKQPSKPSTFTSSHEVDSFESFNEIDRCPSRFNQRRPRETLRVDTEFVVPEAFCSLMLLDSCTWCSFGWTWPALPPPLLTWQNLLPFKFQFKQFFLFMWQLLHILGWQKHLPILLGLSLYDRDDFLSKMELSLGLYVY